MKTQSLRDAVARVIPAIDSKGLVKSFTNLSFHDSQIDATDGSLLATVTLDEAVPSFIIAGDLFRSLLSTITEDDVSLIIKDGHLVVKTKRIVGKLLLPAGVDAPKLKLDIAEWVPVPAGFIKGLSLCSHAASTDQTAGVLTGVRVVGSNMTASDRFRISSYVFLAPEKWFGPMVVPVDLIALIGKQSAAIDEMAVVDDTAYFRSSTKKFIVGSKLLRGNYPEQLGQFLDSLKTHKWSNVTLSNETKDQVTTAIDRQNLIQSEVIEFDRSTLFSYDKGTIRLYADNKVFGSIEETLEGVVAEVAGLTFAFNINPHFLLDAFTEIDSLLYSEELAVAMFTSASFQYLIKTQKPKVA